MPLVLPNTLYISMYPSEPSYSQAVVEVSNHEMIDVFAFQDSQLDIGWGSVVGQPLTIAVRLTGNGTRYSNPSLLLRPTGRVNKRGPSPDVLPGFFIFNGGTATSVILNPKAAYPSTTGTVYPSGSSSDPWTMAVFLRWSGVAWVIDQGAGIIVSP